MTARRFCAPLLAVALSACAGVLGIEEADLIHEDAKSPDSVGPASDAGSACEQYCNCMGRNCSDSYADETACSRACAAYTDQELRCRTDHCSAAAQDPASQCPHALGNGPCK